jgi:hypothetical protein
MSENSNEAGEVDEGSATAGLMMMANQLPTVTASAVTGASAEFRFAGDGERAKNS